MGFNFSSNSSSNSSSDSEDRTIKKVGSNIDLQNIIENAKNNGLKRIVVKDKRSSPLTVGYSDLYGKQVKVSLFPDLDQTYEIEFV